ncbi:MAG: T9SS type A sorting domain-containing protein [Flavicella sp.]
MKKITQLIFISALLALSSVSLTAQQLGSLSYPFLSTSTPYPGYSVKEVINENPNPNHGLAVVSQNLTINESNSIPAFDPSSRIPDATNMKMVALKGNVTVNGSNTNNKVDIYAIVNTVDLSSFTSSKVSFWTEQRYSNGSGAIFTVNISENFGGLTGDDWNNTTWTDVTSQVVGNIATQGQNPQKWVYGELDLSAYTGNVTLAFRLEADSVAPFSSSYRNGTFNVSDVNFQAEVEDVAAGDVDVSNASSSGQNYVFSRADSADDTTSFSSISTYLDWEHAYSGHSLMLSTGNSHSTPRFSQDANLNPGEGYVFEVNHVYNPVLVSEVTIHMNNVTPNTNNGQEISYWIVQGSNDTTSWDDLCSEFRFYSSTSNDNNLVQPLTTSQTYRYYRLVLNQAWTPKQPYTALRQINFKIGSETSLSNASIEKKSNYEIFPNPSSDIINIQGDSPLESIKLYDITGSLVYATGPVSSIDVRSFVSGVYLLEIKTEEGTLITKKVVVN